MGCSSDDDCAGATPRCLIDRCADESVANQWICRNRRSAMTATLHYTFAVVEFLTRTPPKRLTVKACRSNDVACSSPVDEYSDDEHTGYVQLTLPVGFQGYFELTSDLLPTLLYVTKPIVQSAETRAVPLVSEEALRITAEYAGFKQTPDTGLVLLEAVACDSVPGGGVAFKVHDVEADQFYDIDMLPDTNATATEYNETNNTATGGFVNVPAGFITFSAHLGVNGQELQSFNAMVRANWVTFIEIAF